MSRVFKSALHKLDVGWLQFDANPAPSELLRRQKGRSRSSIRIQHHIASFRSQTHALLREGRRHNRRMVVQGPQTTFTWLRRNIPSGTKSAPVRSLNGVDLVIVILALGQEKYRFVTLCGAISNRFRMGIGLAPDNFGPQPPSIFLQCERQPPRQSNQVLWFKALRSGGSHRHGASSVLLVRSSVATISRSIGISHIEPNGSVFF